MSSWGHASCLPDLAAADALELLGAAPDPVAAGTLARHRIAGALTRARRQPTNVAVWRIAIGVELGQCPAIAERITREPIDLDTLGGNDRVAALQLDLARSWAQAEGARDAEAIRHLDAADRLAPQRIRNDPLARDLVLTLNRRARRSVWELVAT